VARACRLWTLLLPDSQWRERGGRIRSSERVQRELMEELRRVRLSECMRAGHAWLDDKSVFDEVVSCGIHASYDLDCANTLQVSLVRGILRRSAQRQPLRVHNHGQRYRQWEILAQI
jgi:hypothetical protein